MKDSVRCSINQFLNSLSQRFKLFFWKLEPLVRALNFIFKPFSLRHNSSTVQCLRPSFSRMDIFGNISPEKIKKLE